jgi:hypothetical protein
MKALVKRGGDAVSWFSLNGHGWRVRHLWLTHTSLNVSFLGAIIGVGIAAKNGILMLVFRRSLALANRTKISSFAFTLPIK